jgi:hypothetical protein
MISVKSPEDPVVEFERSKKLQESLFLDVPDEIPPPADAEILRNPTSFSSELMDHFASDP